MKHPTLLRCFLGLIALGISARAEMRIDLGSPTSRTPYDAYLTPVWSVLRQLNGPKADTGLAAQLVRQGRGFRYSYKKDEPYVPQAPELTEATKSGDCKAKSLWLASKLNDRNVRFVIGKAKREQGMSHAWIIWDGPEGWMILDATLYSTPLSPARLAPTEFVPIYSFAPSGKYTHNVAGGAGGAKNGDHL